MSDHDTTKSLLGVIGGMRRLRPHEHRAIFDPDFEPPGTRFEYAAWCVAYRICDEQLDNKWPPKGPITIYPDYTWVAEQITGQPVDADRLGDAALAHIRQEIREMEDV